MVWLLFFADGKGLVMDWLEARGLSTTWVIVLTAAIYALALAIPFVPAVEMGWMVMAALGTPGIVAIWMATPVGLLVAFVLGQNLRDWPVIQRLQQRLDEAFQSADDDRIRSRLLRFSERYLVAHPYWVLVVLVNLPGNWMIGGGGGIGLLAGASGLYHPVRFFLILFPATGVVSVAMLLGIYGRTVL
ncbi:hypothetical protein BGP77_12475 [Saccharospirillum sp. MSK14-1]|uniref:hypothetical protein n=1 Tax=Saccharospirillum sp. MSK14-1 TaxID=1897632 RepID=UPI000D4F16C7|nr:hypothetical protein [Saccharospirillum sp. MSK14-1]PTY38515.1 hypothetical protein BGP77_12475 [Saccharospirillum sp. MSK14-1]